ncbi:Flp pilus assembly protein CpaB [Rhodococcus sp. 27YEA15]|uniref:SAF domain-containing protein n=1 Tax=Rhodococcus sp. 27YEA15 TaxID=3156259 RepID=UPI003C7A6A45
MPPALPHLTRIIGSRAAAHRDLTPNLVDRLSVAAESKRVSATVVRRVAALALALLGIVLLVRPDPASERIAVVVAAHDLSSGRVIEAADLDIREFAAGQLPDGTLTEPADALGSTAAGPMRAGEIVTDSRLLGSRLAGLAVGSDDARIVPVRLADPAVANILHTGDSVDVLTTMPDTPNESSNHSAPRVLANGAIVVLVTAPTDTRNQREQVVMLALPVDAAHAVAAASLATALTVTFR